MPHFWLFFASVSERNERKTHKHQRNTLNKQFPVPSANCIEADRRKLVTKYEKSNINCEPFYLFLAGFCLSDNHVFMLMWLLSVVMLWNWRNVTWTSGFWEKRGNENFVDHRKKIKFEKTEIQTKYNDVLFKFWENCGVNLTFS